jgi:enamine deaminase RidA (YjgF/YER057c/UK114 family)
MPNEVITAAGAAPPTGPFAPAVLATGTRVLSISGQIADGADGQIVGGDDAGEQARQALRNLDALLVAAGARRTDIVKISVFLTDISDRAAVAAARTEYFGDHKPAATLFAVSGLVTPQLRVEIEATAIF